LQKSKKVKKDKYKNVTITTNKKMIHVEIVKCNELAQVPTRGSNDAAGSDLYSTEQTTILPGQRKLIGTGLKMQIPKDVYGRIAPRSGLAYKHGIDTLAGVIDPDYRGEVKVLLLNTSDKEFEIVIGDRIAQLIFERFATPQFQETETFSENTNRGEGGFGSTGGFGKETTNN
jgi:dUTP pyrophosphatase